MSPASTTSAPSRSDAAASACAHRPSVDRSPATLDRDRAMAELVDAGPSAATSTAIRPRRSASAGAIAAASADAPAGSTTTSSPVRGRGDAGEAVSVTRRACDPELHVRTIAAAHRCDDLVRTRAAPRRSCRGAGSDDHRCGSHAAARARGRCPCPHALAGGRRRPDGCRRSSSVSTVIATPSGPAKST